jgi:hypothetical protein
VEETEKRLGAIILSGIPMISLDNCTHDLGGELLLWLGEPDPVASVDKTQAEDPELAEVRELCEWWRSELRLDEDYLSARLVEIAHEVPVGFNTNPLKDLLPRIAGDKDGDVSAKRLGEWLRRNSGRVVRLSDGHRYWLIRKQNRTGRAAFRLSRVT